MALKRLSVPELLHEAFHFFTHLDKGFLYTLKMLVVAPGTMQRAYISGNRVKHQKPFSMFFISGTLCALVFYWVGVVLLKKYHVGETQEADFFHHYWVLFQVVMFPFYCLIVFLCFRRSGFNFGEIAVFQLYTFSFLFLLLALIHLTRFIVPDLETRYIELPVAIIYSIKTNINFFYGMKKGSLVFWSIVSIAAIFLLAAMVQDRLIELLP